MAILDLFKRRQPHTIYLEIDKKKKAFLIPTQFTVEEVEHILEIQAEKEELVRQSVDEDSIESVQAIEKFFDSIYTQLLVLFNHYQPEIDKEFLLKHVGREEAVEIIGFFTAEHIKNVEEDAKNVKKKVTVKN